MPFKIGCFLPLLLSCPALKSYGQTSCLTQYDVQLTLQANADSFEIADLYLPSSDSLFSLSITNRGRQKISVASVPTITYEDDRFKDTDIFFHLWYTKDSDKWIRYRDHEADICPVGECPEELCYRVIKPGEQLLATRRMNPFSIHGTKGPGEYRLQAFYRYKTPCGDYAPRSNFLYIKAVQHKPFPKPINIEE